jgi:hypothetical protein
MSRLTFLLLLVAALLALPRLAWAEEATPDLAPVPGNLPAVERASFIQQRAALGEERGALKGRLDAHNAKTAEKGSPEAAALEAEAKVLGDEIQKHFRACAAFNLAVAFAQRRHDKSNQWLPLTAPTRNDKDRRSAADYAKVIDQFQVMKSERYQPNADTFCNIFAWDVTRAMGAELPHWVLNSDQGKSAADADGKFAVPQELREELDVKATVAWLGEHGNENGWRRVDARGAQQAAEEGHPAVAVWENPLGKHGHIAVIRPATASPQTGAMPKGPAIAQAGLAPVIMEAKHLTDGVKDPRLRAEAEYWYHE